MCRNSMNHEFSQTGGVIWSDQYPSIILGIRDIALSSETHGGVLG